MKKIGFFQSRSNGARHLRKLADKEAKNVRKEQKNALKRYKQKHGDRVGEIFSDERWCELFGDDKFVLIDIGAAGGLGKEWRKVTPLIRVIRFSR